jgi:hypothetical protein
MKALCSISLLLLGSVFSASALANPITVNGLFNYRETESNNDWT